MIGPASSDDLLKLLTEEVPPRPGCLTDMAIYSPWATANWPPEQVSSVAYLQPAGIRFVRMIGTDESLMPELSRELAARGVKPPLGRHSIAVVHEMDTSYGRDIVESVGDRLCRRDNSDAQCVYALGYLRGIDGKIPRRSNPKDASGDAKLPEMKPGPDSSDSLERAEDDSQFDYLRRLAARMRSEHERLVRNGQKGILAVGVFGSDLYDKLLVLQALRQEFPTAPFFTTDLDARFMHPREFQWTRNLIVASSFGLQLREEIQEGLPPFRNNYQTATFLAVTVAVVNALPNGQQGPVSDKTITKWLEDPGVYEIGRTEALDVSRRWVEPRKVGDDACTSLTDCLGVHPKPVFFDSPDVKTFTYGALGILFTVVLAPLVSSNGRRSVIKRARWCSEHPEYAVLVLLAAAILVEMFVLGVINEDKDRGGEPFRFFEGVSIWPTEILRVVAFCVAVTGIIMTEIQRKRTDRRLQSRYFAGLDTPENNRARVRPRVAELVHEAWAAVKLVGGVLMSGSVPVRAPAQSGWSTWGRVFAGKPDRGYFYAQQFVPTEDLWLEHCYQNSAVARWTRILIGSTLFYALGLFVMLAFGLPTTPARGDFARMVDGIVIFFAVWALIVLIFCVGDTIKLCDKFAYCLGAPEPNSWPPATRKYFGIEPFNRDTPLDGWIDVRFLAEWTGRISGIIYYPFVVLFLLIVARSSIFDNWDMPPSLVAVLLLSITAAAATVFILRGAAERLRRVTVERLTKELVIEEGLSPEAPTVKQLRTVLSEVRDMKQGAFAPITSQPLVRAALLPLSGAGGIALLEYFFLRR